MNTEYCYDEDCEKVAELCVEGPGLLLYCCKKHLPDYGQDAYDRLLSVSGMPDYEDEERS